MIADEKKQINTDISKNICANLADFYQCSSVQRVLFEECKMSISKLDLGKLGEQKAIQYLENKGYRILERNYKTKLGELDIIARDAKTICFIEVKTRSSQEKGEPLESITSGKQHRLCKLALSYLKLNNLLNRPARFDVVSVYQNGSQIDIQLIKNAFELDRIYTY